MPWGAPQRCSPLNATIPANSSLVGQTFFGRSFVQDANAAGGVAVTPAFRFTVFGDTSGLTTNAIDDSQVFVTQHYRDFLNREPDSSGLGFWTNSITQCGTNQG